MMSKITDLEAKICRLERALADVKEFKDQCYDNWTDEAKAGTLARVERDKYKVALEKYGQHIPYINPETGKHQKGCMLLCEEDLSGMCDCGFRVNRVRCQKCHKGYSVSGIPKEAICPVCTEDLSQKEGS